jgi:hypothetical protein
VILGTRSLSIACNTANSAVTRADPSGLASSRVLQPSGGSAELTIPDSPVALPDQPSSPTFGILERFTSIPVPTRGYVDLNGTVVSPIDVGLTAGVQIDAQGRIYWGPANRQSTGQRQCSGVRLEHNAGLHLGNNSGYITCNLRSGWRHVRSIWSLVIWGGRTRLWTSRSFGVGLLHYPAIAVHNPSTRLIAVGTEIDCLRRHNWGSTDHCVP